MSVSEIKADRAFHNWEHGRNRVKDKPSHKPEESTSEIKTDAQPEQAGEQNREARGVIRLLQEGHFKGVADIRLRINFFDELSALKESARQEVEQAGVAEIEETISGRVSSLLDEEELSEEEIQAVTEALGNFQNAQEAGGGNALAGLLDRFESLRDALAALAPVLEETTEEPGASELVQPVTTEETPADGPVQVSDAPTEPVEEPAADAPVSDVQPVLEEAPAGESPPLVVSAEEDETEDSFDWAAFVDQLSAEFNELVGELEEETAATSVLPEISSPSGRGRAYDKFLAIYQNLLNTGAEPQNEPADAGVEVLV